jgi:hypothetical protein
MGLAILGKLGVVVKRAYVMDGIKFRMQHPHPKAILPANFHGYLIKKIPCFGPAFYAPLKPEAVRFIFKIRLPRQIQTEGFFKPAFAVITITDYGIAAGPGIIPQGVGFIFLYDLPHNPGNMFGIIRPVYAGNIPGTGFNRLPADIPDEP